MKIIPIHILVLVSGMAALSWQVLWQVKSSLALGVSAWGTALTLAITMGGMCLGSLTIGHVLKDKPITQPIRIYAVLECIIGVAGLCLGAAFTVVEGLDTWAWQAMPGNAPLVHFLGIILTLGVPTICMGATLPVLGLMARQSNLSLAILYGFNTLGAATGALLAAFVLIPFFGVAAAAIIIAGLNLGVGAFAWTVRPESAAAVSSTSKIFTPAIKIHAALFTVFATGFATFALEVAWFRSLTAAFRSTTDAFAIMLACVLIALGLGARLVPYLKRRNVSLGTLTGWAGILILLATPLVERFDLLTVNMSSVAYLLPKWFFLTFCVIGPPVLLLGIALPWILEQQDRPRRWGGLYAFNAFASVLGALCAAWILLPLIGFAKTAWLAGALVAVAGFILSADTKRKTKLGGFALAAFLVAFMSDSGVGRIRTQGWHVDNNVKPARVLESYEGPDATVSAVEYENGQRSIIIDGFSAAQQLSAAGKTGAEHYMTWMGHLPMLLHENPKNALVICFGTGQTANAVRRENPETLDIVDINPRVFKLAHNFSENEGVLNDPRVTPIIMDGRAYMRRTEKMYDIITLEPMPPTFAGVNALYAKEFYESVRARLNPGGVIVQWVPFHILGLHSSLSIARTFREIFPNALLWVDPYSGTGILLGSSGDGADFGKNWPGFLRGNISRDMSIEEVKQALVLGQDGMEIYTQEGDLITDDNQLLAYGRAVSDWHRFGKLEEENLIFLRAVHAQIERVK
ncbi:MAG TPA: fused MFS/spermidine synthase [Alphaproteobacteria bacterium]|nr:fused MFS/spermidine synthase [Alphaproteobacteria bacterium]